MRQSPLSFELSPSKAWIDQLRARYLSEPNKWLENSHDISPDIPLSNRELFALIILAYARNGDGTNQTWNVGYDAAMSQPNDGLITDGNERIHIESKLVAQMDKREVLDAILGTYAKYQARGSAYGNNRSLVIYGNKATRGLIKVSSLHDEIAVDCPFDRVFLVHAVVNKMAEGKVVMHITQHFPSMELTQVDFNIIDGSASVPYANIDW